MTHDTHVSDEELAAWLDRRLEAPGRMRVQAHLVECDECRAVVTEATAALSAKRRRKRMAFLATGGMAAAALVLLVVSGTLPISRDTKSTVRGAPPLLTEDVSRLAALLPEPRAVVPRDSLVFVWQSTPEGTVFQVTVSDERGVMMWDDRTGDTTLALPVAVARSLVPGQIYYWKVEALLPDLRTASTGVNSFIVREP
jgi:anti-sigma factor ChrR (cupin superfamily)